MCSSFPSAHDRYIVQEPYVTRALYLYLSVTAVYLPSHTYTYFILHLRRTNNPPPSIDRHTHTHRVLTVLTSLNHMGMCAQKLLVSSLYPQANLRESAESCHTHIFLLSLAKGGFRTERPEVLRN